MTIYANYLNRHKAGEKKRREAALQAAQDWWTAQEALPTAPCDVCGLQTSPVGFAGPGNTCCECAHVARYGPATGTVPGDGPRPLRPSPPTGGEAGE